MIDLALALLTSPLGLFVSVVGLGTALVVDYVETHS